MNNYPLEELLGSNDLSNDLKSILWRRGNFSKENEGYYSQIQRRLLSESLSNYDDKITLLIKWLKKFMSRNKTNLARREGKNKSEPKKDTSYTMSAKG